MTQESAALDSIRNDIQRLTKLTDNSYKELKQEIENLAENKKAVAIKIENNAKDIQFLSDFISKQTRAKNVIIFGLTDNHDENIWAKISELFLQVNLEIPDTAFEDIFRVGKNTTTRPVVVKFMAARWVKIVFFKTS